MGNKNKIAFLTLALSVGLVVGACTPNLSRSVSSDAVSSAPASPYSVESVNPSSNAVSNSEVLSSSQSSKVNASSSSNQYSLSSETPVQSNDSQANQSSNVSVQSSQADASSSLNQYSSSSNAPVQSNDSQANPSSDSSAQSSGDNASSSSNSNSSDADSSSSSNTTTYKVDFVVDGVIEKTYQVEEGQTVSYDGDVPTKSPDANACKYRFKNWDKDITQPITENTTFNAVFAEYAEEIIVDDFENYSGAGSLKDAGWAAWTLSGSGWTTETQASVSISRNAADGNKALRLDAWQNDCDFKAVKTLSAPFEKSANAIQFKLMIPSEMKSVKILLKGEVEIAGTLQAPSFSYILHPTSSEYMEYTIPLADDGWALWDDPTKTIKSVAGWTGIHEDDYLQYLTSIDFYARGNDGLGGQAYLAFIDSVKFVTLDNPEFKQTQELKQYDRYTGTLSDGHILRVDLGDNGSATANIIDLEVPQTIPGNYVITNDEITFTSADDGISLIYKGDITNGGQLIKYKSAAGNYADLVLDMNLDAVQVVNNFEQYTESGEAYSQQNFDDTIGSGLRGDFYGEYYASSGASDWGGSGWQILENGDEVNLLNDGGAHSGNNYASFKHMKSNAIRYIQWDLFKGYGDKYSFRGSKLGLWVKGFVDKLTIYMYSRSNPTAANKNERVKTGQFALGRAIDEWQHIEVDLNSKLVYYGFIISIEKDYISDAQLFVDDIEVYTADPYAKYTEPVPEEPKHFTPGQSYLAKLNGLFPIKVSFDRDNAVDFSVPHKSISVTGTYAINEDDVTLTLDGTTYTATIADDYSKLTFKAVGGSDDIAAILNDVSFNQIDYAETGETYESVGQMYYESFTDESKISGARGAYYCDRYTGSGSTPVGGNGWALMGGSGDQVGFEEGGVLGYHYPTFKRSNGADLRYIQWDLYKGTAKERKGVDTFSVYLKNPASNEMHIKLYVFKNKQVNPANQLERVEREITIPANQDWTEYKVTLNPEVSYYGFGLYTYKGSTNAYLGLDAACFYGVDDNPNYSFYAKNNMVISGPINVGEASLKFGTGSKAYLTCAAASLTNQQVTYTMEVTDDGQIMTISMGDHTLKGIYAVDADYNVTFTVTEATGNFAALVTIGAVFSN